MESQPTLGEESTLPVSRSKYYLPGARGGVGGAGLVQSGSNQLGEATQVSESGCQLETRMAKPVQTGYR